MSYTFYLYLLESKTAFSCYGRFVLNSDFKYFLEIKVLTAKLHLSDGSLMICIKLNILYRLLNFFIPQWNEVFGMKRRV
uniref:Uncharacterized protein n=1 Tax=Onchocerca volvulus TaxID=6282 RepID=A0A8R1U3F2_ONCVO